MRMKDSVDPEQLTSSDLYLHCFQKRVKIWKKKLFASCVLIRSNMVGYYSCSKQWLLIKSPGSRILKQFGKNCH